MTPDPPDINKITAEVIVAATERAISSVSAPARATFRRLLQTLTDAYRPYLGHTFARVRTIKTFLKPNEPVDLLSHYVPVTLKTESKSFRADDIVTLASRKGRVVISGLAGRGKSVLMRFIALSLYHAPRGKIPLFVELRALNGLSVKDLLQYIHAQYRGNSEIQLSDFHEALRKGYFCLLLDGFDEVDPESRELIEAQILDLAFKYRELPIIISGRPDQRFVSWEHFTVFHVCPMTLRQTRQLIENADYDTDVTRTFLKRLTPEFFNKHESFLSTPLLAIMLMLTFEEYAEIPNSLHVFYRNAFETLVRRHDAMKSQFLRKTHSRCTADELKKVFASFCVLTYSRSQFQFSNEEVIDSIRAALKQQRIRANPDHLLADLTESICLLQKEGFEISFVHRSFQEYFCALFVSQAPAGVVSQYLDSGRFRIEDSVLPMLYGMVPERVESEWANETVSSILREFPSESDRSRLEFLRRLFPTLEFAVFGDRTVHILMNEEGPLMRTTEILRRLYPAHFYARESKRRNLSEAAAEQWNADVIGELKKLQDLGGPAFRDVPPLNSITPEIRRRGLRISMDVGPGQEELLRVSGLDDYSAGLLKSLKAIQRDQRLRSKGDDAFLKSVFS